MQPPEFAGGMAPGAERTGRESGCADPTLDLPRILCLHGGGTNAQIFRAQCRVIRAHLADSFRLVFADAPFPFQPGPDVTPVYSDWGPFRAWLPRPGIMELNVDRIDGCISAAMRADDQAGATGQWAGLIGFSQGASLAASLLLRQQRHNESQTSSWGLECSVKNPSPGYRFAVLFAGRGPLMDMGSFGDNTQFGSDLLRLPIIHVHGLQDPGIEMHRGLLHCCLKSNTRLVDWDRNHRMPVTTKDVSAVVAEIQGLTLNLQVADSASKGCCGKY
ncbi:hypothetical protein N7527_000382 [Penicillium freii]|nr:hypothetical protein N7527_000382 [Penicillium freii]